MFNQDSQSGLDIRQIEVLRKQQAAGKAQAAMNLAVNLYINGKEETIPDAFDTAEEFILEFERRYLNANPH